MESTKKEVLVEVKDLRISATSDEGVEIPIVKGVDFNIHKGEVVALIGESGSGKTTISLASLAYTKPGLHFAGGEVKLKGEDLLSMDPKASVDARVRAEAFWRNPGWWDCLHPRAASRHPWCQPSGVRAEADPGLLSRGALRADLRAQRAAWLRTRVEY